MYKKAKKYHTPYIPFNDVEKLFNKKIILNKHQDWVLPDANCLYTTDSFEIEALQKLKNELNSVKSKLNDYLIEEWSDHTKKRNPAGEISWRLRTEINAEFVTQAWCKMFECLNTYNIVDLKLKILNTVHLCEAPGAFITALNHYLKTHSSDIEWHWCATTLNPYYEGNPLSNMILDDRLILHTLENWEFGHDFTGNIMNSKNVKSLQDRCNSIGPIHLVTADGSIDCMDMPECQEETVASLHFAELIAALRILSPGGNILLKMFTFFEHTSISLLYLMSCCFRKINIFKPVTSKVGNSEVYVIGLEFSCPENLNEYLDVMARNINNTENSMFPLEAIPETFIKQIEICAKYFMKLQIEVIENNIVYFRNFNRNEYQVLKFIRSEVCRQYFHRCNVKRIPEEAKLLFNKNIIRFPFFNNRVDSGSHTARVAMNSLQQDELVHELRKKFAEYEEYLCWPYDTDQQELQLEPLEEDIENSFEFSYGQSIDKINSSKFVFVPLFRFMIKLLNNSQLNLPQSMNENNPTAVDIKDSSTIFITLKKFNLFQNYTNYEMEIVESIKNTIETITTPVDIHIFNLFLISQYLVGFFYLIKLHVIKDIIVIKNSGIILRNVQPTAVESFKKIYSIIKKARENCGNNENGGNDDDIKSIIALVCIKNLCHDEHFYNLILNYNNFACLEFCHQCLK